VNAIELFDVVADRRGAAPAILWEEGRAACALSFAALAGQSRRLASLFLRSGLVPGDAVVVMLPVRGTFFVVTAALLRAGLTAVFIDPNALRATIAAAVAGVPVRAVVGSPAACALRWLVPELRAVPLVFVAGHWPGARPLAAAETLAPLGAPIDRAPGAVALVSFTSGTTGAPKGVLRTHAVLAATQRLLATRLELVAGETHLSVLPFVVLASVGAGATNVLPEGNLARPGRLDPARLGAAIRRHSVDVVVASPGIAGRLAAGADASAPFASLRRVYLGGAPVLPPLFDRWRVAAPGARVTALYGATEVEPIATLDGQDYGDAERRATSAGAGVLVGDPVPGIDVRIVPECPDRPEASGAASAPPPPGVAPGVEGEIVVAGPHVAPGYLRRDGDPSSLMAAGRRWHRTGDAGYLDARGRLWLTGRCADRVATCERTLHALRVEAALADDPALAHVAFLQVDGERLVLIETRSRGTAVPVARIAARTAFARPHAIAIIGRMPVDRRHAVKIDYRRLAGDVAAGRVRICCRLAQHGAVPGNADAP